MHKIKLLRNGFADSQMGISCDPKPLIFFVSFLCDVERFFIDCLWT